MNDWMILGIEETDDLKKVKHAYAEKAKLYHPETHPEEFQKLHNAYKRIVAGIQGRTDYQQILQVSEPPATRLSSGVGPARDTKQDMDFLKLVEAVAKNFESRHTDKRDPAQVAKVESILQHDKRNAELLRQFQWMLYNEFFKEGWRKFFIADEFLDRQYEPEFISGMTEIVKSRIFELQRAKKGAYGLGVVVYFIIVYGADFEGMEHLQTDQHIYRKELLQGLADLFSWNGYMRNSYRLIENNQELLGEQCAFSLYRSILQELDADMPAKEKIKQVIIDGFQKENISRLFFDLLLYLAASNRKNISIFKASLAQVCEMEWDSRIQDEVEILKLELADLGETGEIERETQRTEEQTPEIRKDILTCDCRTWKYGCIAVVVFVMGLFLIFGIPILSLSTAMAVSERVSLIMLCAWGGILALAGDWMCVQYIKNWTVIFHEEGIWYRNLFGKVYNYTDAEIKGYIITRGPKYYYIILATESKRIYISYLSRNYQSAKELVRRKYREL